MKVFNAEGMVLGRLSTSAAKAALLGEEVIIVNCEKAVISGSKVGTVAKEKQKRDRKGYPLKSAKFSRLPDRFVRRTVRGMLPWKQDRGKEAFRRIMCYVGFPEEFAKETVIITEKAAAKKLPTLKYITVGEVCKSLGGK